ncbi:MAG: carbon storage regulator, partial [Phycisphaerae bacterium]
MLVLSRKPQQQILIPELNICITVLSISPGRVQIGIEAPQGIHITRPDAVSPRRDLERTAHCEVRTQTHGYEPVSSESIEVAESEADSAVPRLRPRRFQSETAVMMSKNTGVRKMPNRVTPSIPENT